MKLTHYQIMQNIKASEQPFPCQPNYLKVNIVAIGELYPLNIYIEDLSFKYALYITHGRDYLIPAEGLTYILSGL